MKIELPFIAGLMFLGADLMARIAAQGFEQALCSTVIDWSMKRFQRYRRGVAPAV